MPIGLVSDDLLKDELDRCSGVSKRKVLEGTIVDKPSRGRADGDSNVPESLRKIIGETAVIDGRQAALDLAKDFGISPASVSAYANGATSTASYDSPNKELIAHINKSRARAIKKAQNTLNGALGAITQEKLDYTDAKDLASIAKDMTVVIKNLEPKSESDPAASNQPQFVIFAPQFRKEESFEIITVNE
jgi:transcriptional regulator with XRE-family HTH domain